VTYTPGPWKWWTSNSWRRLSQDVLRGAKDGGVLCPTLASDGHPDLSVTREDMALIAAAPDLFEALTALYEHNVNPSDHQQWPVVLKRAQDAIRKAGGKA
jgi:hypothetical protein